MVLTCQLKLAPVFSLVLNENQPVRSEDENHHENWIEGSHQRFIEVSST